MNILKNINSRFITAFATALLFVAVQVVGVFHQAEFGFKGHTHNGQTCQISLFSEHNKVANAPSSMLEHVAFISTIQLTEKLYSTVVEGIKTNNQSRAPPVSLIS